MGHVFPATKIVSIAIRMFIIVTNVPLGIIVHQEIALNVRFKIVHSVKSIYMNVKYVWVMLGPLEIQNVKHATLSVWIVTSKTQHIAFNALIIIKWEKEYVFNALKTLILWTILVFNVLKTHMFWMKVVSSAKKVNIHSIKLVLFVHKNVNNALFEK